MEVETMNKMSWSFKHNYGEFHCERPIIVRDRKYNPHDKRCKNQQLFGFKFEEYERSTLLTGLQKIVDELVGKSKIDVRAYNKTSQLMLKVCYEYGCFKGVMESYGVDNTLLRESILFPKVRLNDSRSYYELQNLDRNDARISKILKDGPYVYLDRNGAFAAAATGVPLDLECKDINPKLAELFEKMFAMRKKYKVMEGTIQKLQTTIKVMMCCLYGLSITKPKKVKTKHCKESIDKIINEYGSLVCKSVPTEGTVQLVEPFRPNFNYPQYAKVMLDNYHEFMRRVSELVHVYYFNVDAIVIHEKELHKIKDNGLKGDNMGQFKIDHVFKEIYFRSPYQWIGVKMNGELLYHGFDSRKVKPTLEEFRNAIVG
jgi:hypothetical protein